jgi:hypothetical protein
MKRMIRFCRVPLGVFAVSLAVLGIGAASAQAAVVFNGSPGTGAPPATLGPYSMVAFGADPQPLGTDVSGVAATTGERLASPPRSFMTQPRTGVALLEPQAFGRCVLDWVVRYERDVGATGRDDRVLLLHRAEC